MFYLTHPTYLQVKFSFILFCCTKSSFLENLPVQKRLYSWDEISYHVVKNSTEQFFSNKWNQEQSQKKLKLMFFIDIITGRTNLEDIKKNLPRKRMLFFKDLKFENFHRNILLFMEVIELCF